LRELAKIKNAENLSVPDHRDLRIAVILHQ
jgi:hypothetical protein